MEAKVRKYCFGYLRIRIRGDSLERFLNLCSNQSIEVWNLRVDGSEYVMNILVKDFFQLKPIIRKTRTKVNVVERKGFPFFVQRYRGKTLFIVGMITCIFFIFIMSTFVWGIEINGNDRRSEEELIKFLRKNQIYEGKRKSRIPCEKISELIRENYEDIIWVSTSIDGMILKIEVKESQNIGLKEEIEDCPMDIVASKNGVITSIVTSRGVPMVKQEDLVQRGDLLVSGNLILQNDAKETIGYQYCKSEAEIMAKTEIEYQDSIQKKYRCWKETGRKTYSLWIEIDGKRWTVGNRNPSYKYYKKEMEEKRFLWWKFGYEILKECEKHTKTYSNQQIKQVLSENHKIFCRNLEKKGVQILENNVKIYCGIECSSARGIMILEEDIGQLIPTQPLTEINIE